MRLCIDSEITLRAQMSPSGNKCHAIKPIYSIYQLSINSSDYAVVDDRRIVYYFVKIDQLSMQMV